MAEHEATRERAAAQLEQERVELHERGLADHELVADDDRERFTRTSAVRTNPVQETAATQDEGLEPGPTDGARHPMTPERATETCESEPRAR
jgi:hypothetical protein